MTELQKTENNFLKNMETRWKIAEFYAAADILPEAFKGKPANVMIAMEGAEQLSRANRTITVNTVMQNSIVVKGKLGYYSKFKIALANTSGKLDKPMEFEVVHDPNNMSVKAIMVIKGVRHEKIVDIALAKKEGWYARNSKYQSMPDQMLIYRAASMLIDTVIPEVVFGMQTSDEIIDVEGQDIVIDKAEPKALTGDIIDEDLL